MAVRTLTFALAILTFGLLQTGPLSAQLQATPPLVTGMVVSTDGARPMADVVVRIPSLDRSGLTNSEGRYLILLDSTHIGQTVEIRATYAGFGTAVDSVTITAEGDVLNLALTRNPLRVDSIRELAQRRELPANPAGPQRITIAPTSFADAEVQFLPAPPGGFPPPGDREGYAPIEENAFRAVSTAPLSTFSIDVDRASYANVRRFLHDGRLPPRDAVRIEELINYFPYDDPAPEGDLPFAITTEYTTAPWNTDHGLLRVALKGKSIDIADAPPANLVFLMDVSGSMNSPDKLPLLKTAFRMLVESMRPEDRVAIVVYAGAAGLVLESTPAADKPTVLSAIERLQAGGSTAGGAGIRLAYEVAAENHVEG